MMPIKCLIKSYKFCFKSKNDFLQICEKTLQVLKFMK